jgi:hypothetical protein
LGLTHGSIGSERGGELLKICLRGRNMSVAAYEVAAFAAMIVVFEHTASSISTDGNGDLICHDASCICVTLPVDTVMWRLSTARPLTCVIFVQDRFDGTCFARDVLYCSSRWSARQFSWTARSLFIFRLVEFRLLCNVVAYPTFNIVHRNKGPVNVAMWYVSADCVSRLCLIEVTGIFAGQV